MSSDKRMAIEGALLREAVRLPLASIRWIDGVQNIADILTKQGADKTYFRRVLLSSQMCLTQDEESARLKAQKRAQHHRRKVDTAEKDRLVEEKRSQRRVRIAAAVREMVDESTE